MASRRRPIPTLSRASWRGCAGKSGEREAGGRERRTPGAAARRGGACRLRAACAPPRPPSAGRSLSLDQVVAHHRRHLLDGGPALPAAALRLSHGCPARLGRGAGLQGDGTAALPGHHAAGDGPFLAARPLSRLVRLRFPGRLAACQARPGHPHDRRAPVLWPGRQGLRRGPQHLERPPVAHLERGAGAPDDPHRHSGRRQTVLSLCDKTDEISKPPCGAAPEPLFSAHLIFRGMCIRSVNCTRSPAVRP
nr:hypothetical protein SHINE37_43988 [Rhizobiaceae bacterium]